MKLLESRFGGLSLSLIGVALVAGWACSGAGAELLWSNSSGTIGMGDQAGGHVVRNLLDVGKYNANDLAIGGNQAYWTEYGGQVSRATISGSHLTHVDRRFLTGSSNLDGGVAVSGKFIYWEVSFGIERAELNRSHVDAHFIHDPNLYVSGGALTISGDHLYWSDGCSTIMRAQLNGSHVASHIDHIASITPYGGADASGGTDSPGGFCNTYQVAVSGSYLYWAGNALIGRLKLTGSHASDIDRTFIHTVTRSASKAPRVRSQW